MDRLDDTVLHAEVLHFEDLLREEMHALTERISEEPMGLATRLVREKCHGLRIELLRMVRRLGDGYAERATRDRVRRLDVDLDQLLSIHDRQLAERRRTG